MKRALAAWLLILFCSLAFSPALAYNKLEKGMEGSDVLNLQYALQSLGYSIVPDGKYGAATMATVKSFQRQHSLSPDGVAGNQTLTELYRLAPSFDPGYSAPVSFLTPSPVPAPSGTGDGVATVAAPSGSLNLRAGAAASARVLTAIPDGEKVIVVQRGSAWSSVLYNGMAGYVMTQYLRFGNAVLPTAAPTALPTLSPVVYPGATQAMAVTSGGSLNLRETANSVARVIGTIPSGAWVTVTVRGSAWCAVQYNGQSGYVMSQYLSFGAPVQTPLPTLAPTALPTAVPQPSFGETAWVSTTGGSLNLREAASGTARVLTALPNGVSLTVLSKGDVWCAVSYQGIPGYVMTAYLRFSGAALPLAPTATPSPVPTPAVIPTWNPGGTGTGTVAYVNTTGGSLNLRETGRSSAKILTVIPNGTALVILERGSVWCSAVYNGVFGYVMTSFLSFPGSSVPSPTPTPTPSPAPTVSPMQTAGTALVTTSGGSVNLRAGASTSAKVLASVPNAAIVTVNSRGSTWSQITCNGQTGYMMSQYLTFLGGSAAPASGDPNREEDDPSVFTRILKKGMTGADVTWVQNRLADLGYSLSLTNLYDDATFSAVKAFQTQNGLTADGLAGEQTFLILKSDSARRAGSAPLTYSTLRVDNTGDGVRQVQTDLKNLGYPVAVNGKYDEATHNAVVAFQQRNGLVISGIADSLTRQVLHGGGGKPYSTPVETLPDKEGWIQGPSVGEIKLLHWQNEIKPTVKSGQSFTVFDPNTHLSWKLIFYSLGRHADSQPASWRDTRIMNRSFGSTSWTIHPVYVQLPSGQWTLATMHNRPHLYGTITNNGFGGHLCVHFLRDMAEAQKNDPNYGVSNQVTLRNAWKALTGETVN